MRLDGYAIGFGWNPIVPGAQIRLARAQVTRACSLTAVSVPIPGTQLFDLCGDPTFRGGRPLHSAASAAKVGPSIRCPPDSQRAIRGGSGDDT